jgi:hypothetical protein
VEDLRRDGVVVLEPAAPRTSPRPGSSSRGAGFLPKHTTSAVSLVDRLLHHPVSPSQTATPTACTKPKLDIHVSTIHDQPKVYGTFDLPQAEVSNLAIDTLCSQMGEHEVSLYRRASLMLESSLRSRTAPVGSSRLAHTSY